jgi:CHAT domain-containing protein
LTSGAGSVVTVTTASLIISLPTILVGIGRYAHRRAYSDRVLLWGDTGRGVQRGDTTMALPLGFFVCGAETVVASLWKVDDTATALLMARFYANWLGTTSSVRTVDGESYSPGQAMPKLAALREARSWLRSLTPADCDRLTGAKPDTIAEEASRGVRRVRMQPNSTPSSSTSDDLPYDHPYFWSAFVLYGHEG